MYTTHFGLALAPFSTAPDPRFFCLSAPHRAALAHLLIGLQAGGGVLVLTGEAGVGKTTVCREFLRLVPAHCDVASLFTPAPTVHGLIAALCEALGSAPPDASSASVTAWTERFSHHLLAAQAGDRRCVLVIDEAHQLSDAVLAQLRLWTQLDGGGGRLLQAVLVGRSGPHGSLAWAELAAGDGPGVSRCHLGPMGLAGTRAYLGHRLQVAGLRGPSPIAPRLVPVVHRLCAGNPRRINLLCHSALREAFAQGRIAVDRPGLRQAGKELGAWFAAWPGQRWQWLMFLWPVVAALVLVGVRGRADAAAARQLAPHATLPMALTGQGQAVPPPPAARPSAPPSPSLSPTAIDRAGFVHLIADAPGPVAALHTLSRHWGEPLVQGAGCVAARQALGLACFESRGGLALLGQLDRPALLLVTARPGAPEAALLLIGMGADQAVFEVRGQPVVVPLALVAEVWQGAFITVWRAPAAHPGGVPTPVPGALVDWLQVNLPSHPASAKAEPPSVALVLRLARFQMAEGLKPDGKPGPATMMALNRRRGVAEPRLDVMPR